MNCECLVPSCNWAQPKCLPTQNRKYIDHTAKSVWVQTTTFQLQHNRSLAISLQTASLTEPTVQRVRNLKVFISCSPRQNIDTATPQENVRLETKHVDAEKQAFRTRRPPILIFSTRYQTGWNVTKCHTCHAKRHDNLLGNLRKRDVLQLAP